MRKRRKGFTTPKMGLPFGIGVLYLMVHIPFFWWWKIGITGVGVGASKRAKRIGQSVFGFPVPVFFVPIPFCYMFEQFLHRMFNGLNVRFYNSDGASEWFWFPVIVFAIPIMATAWVSYFVIIIFCFGGDLSLVFSWTGRIFTTLITLVQ